MKTYTLILGILLTCIFLISCEKDEDTTPDYDQEVIISSTLFETAPNDQLNINSIDVIENNLRINFGSSGCSGSSWELKLIDADVILESYPPQRNLRLSLKNEELCDAYFVKEINFDISKLQVEGNQVILNIDNFETPILYEY